MDHRMHVLLTFLVGFTAWLLATLYNPASRFIPYAYIAGIISTILSIIYVLLTTSQTAQTRPVEGLLSVTCLNSTKRTKWRQEKASLKRRSRYDAPDVWQGSQSAARHLDDILEALWRDFVKSWYGKISCGTNFTNQVDRVSRLSLRNLLNHIIQVDLVDFGVTHILPVFIKHLRAYTEAERRVRERQLVVKTKADQDIAGLISRQYQDGKLHPAISLSASKTTIVQQQHLRRILSKLLPVILPETVQTSPSVLTLVQEIVACAVLLPVMTLLTDPDVMNQLVEAYGRSILHERKTIRKVRAALEEHTSVGPEIEVSVQLPRLTRLDGDQSLEDFSRAIRQCTVVSSLEQAHDTIQTQIKQEFKLPKQDKTYIRKLEDGRKVIEQQIIKLVRSENLDSSLITLRDLFYDASGLAYFMEFMDRSSTISLVQFWIVVDGFRHSVIRGSAHENQVFEQAGPWTQMERDQLVQISGKYLWKPELRASQAIKDAVHTFINAGEAATNLQYSRAKQAVFNLQDLVYERMQSYYFTTFKQSDLWEKLNESTKVIATKSAINGSMKPNSEEVHEDRSLSHTSVQAMSLLRPTELDESVISSSEVVNPSKRFIANNERRSVSDSGSKRRPLFDEELESEHLGTTTHTLNPSGRMSTDGVRDQTRVITAVQAAIDDIVDQEPIPASIFSDWAPNSSHEIDANVGHPRTSHYEPDDIRDNERPSLSSLGLMDTLPERTVLPQDDPHDKKERLLMEDDRDTDEYDVTDDDIREAAPGDLGLSELVDGLSLDIEKLELQRSILGSLTQKAELANNSAELRILRKSNVSIEREIHRKELQKQQYVVQKSENDLFGRANISIKSIMVGSESDGHEFALYVIEVQRYSIGENAPSVTWAITRRYSEFHGLHRRLRKRYPSIRDLEFPRRQMVLTLQKDFLKRRSAALQRYLRELLTHPQICRSLEFRAFLSQQTIRPISNNTIGHKVDKQDFITRIYNSVTDGMEEFVGNMPVLDQLSTAGQNIITAAIAAQPLSSPNREDVNNATSNTGPLTNMQDSQEARRAAAEISAYDGRPNPETLSFVQSICDFIVELFHLNTGQNWLRGRAVVVATQQLFGGTIERKVREYFKQNTTEEKLCDYLDIFKNTLWPNGHFRERPMDRTPEEMEESKQNASIILSALLPDLVGGVVGRGNAQNAAYRAHATLNNAELNRHLAYTVLDEIVEGIFGIQTTVEK